MRIIQFYRTQSGKCPIEEFLDSLPDKDAQKVTWVMRLIEKMDNVLQQYFKKLVNTNDLWEIRAQIGSNAYRLFGFFDKSKLLTLTNGFSKKQQKAPSREIELANQRRKDYLQRRNKV